MKLNFSTKLILIAIIILAGFFRFYGLNWDQGYHLHPDERFLTMVGLEMKTPHSFVEYLSPATSPFNPANIGFSFFVYGVFPLVFTKILSQFTGFIEYDSFTILGRMLSALTDILVVFVIFKTVQLFEKQYKLHPSIKLWASGFYAVSVLPIQLSHFFAVDTFLNFFLFTSFYFMTRFSFQKKITFLILSAVFLGFALASKITAVFIVPLFVLLLLPRKTQKYKTVFQINNLRTIASLCIVYVLTCYLTTRIADPYLFQTNNFFDLQPNKLFLENLQTLKALSAPDTWFPPGIQWLNKPPVLFALQNIALFGLGLPLFLFVLIGMGVILLRYKQTHLLFILVWCLFFFFYQSTQITKTMRYFLILYPFFAIFASIGFYNVTKKLHPIILGTILLITSLWTFCFMAIYTKPHSRVQASYYLYDTIPYGSIILSEHWDDALPLRMPLGKEFTIHELPVFGPDDEEKWRQMNELMATADYLVLSSNRGWGSIPTVPQRYPRMTKFYEDLFANKLAYKKITTFTSYPSLEYLGIPLTIPDDSAEEAFTVYDHPKVIIFQNMKKAH